MCVTDGNLLLMYMSCLVKVGYKLDVLSTVGHSELQYELTVIIR